MATGYGEDGRNSSGQSPKGVLRRRGLRLGCGRFRPATHHVVATTSASPATGPQIDHFLKEGGTEYYIDMILYDKDD